MNTDSTSTSMKRCGRQIITVCVAITAGVCHGAIMFDNVSFSAGNVFGNGQGVSWGFEFQVTSAVTLSVTDLGIWNNRSGDGLLDSHIISIWDGTDSNAPVELAHVAVPSTGTKSGPHC